jgi:Domain of unknown function (DUF222)/HNH endonuclease
MSVDMSALPTDQLEDEIATLAAHIYAGTCRWLELVAELDCRGSWTESGAGSCAEWLAWRCALTPRSAREHVRVARRLRELPLIRERFARGELSYTKVRALTRVAEPENEGELLGLARDLTAAQLERAVRAYRRATAKEANELHELAHFGYGWGDDGSLVLYGRLAPEDGALFLRALEAARDSLWDREPSAGGGSAEPRFPSGRPTNADALLAMADASLAGGDFDRSGGERYQVVVNTDADGAATLDDGPPLAPETAERLACDASVVSGGRKTRTIPPSTRRALRTRDRGCRFPGCENRRFVDAHHVRHWARGGETRMDNLVLLCRRHHRFVHEGGFSVELVEGAPRFRDQWGFAVPHVPRSPPASANGMLEANELLHIGSATCASGRGDEMDLALTVDELGEVLGREPAFAAA